MRARLRLPSSVPGVLTSFRTMWERGARSRLRTRLGGQGAGGEGWGVAPSSGKSVINAPHGGVCTKWDLFCQATGGETLLSLMGCGDKEIT